MFNEKEYKQLENAAKSMGFKSVQEMVDIAIENFIKVKGIDRDEVTVKVPKKLLALVKDMKKKDWIEYLSDCVTDTVAADIKSDVFGDSICIQEEYDLKSEFQFYEGH